MNLLPRTTTFSLQKTIHMLHYEGCFNISSCKINDYFLANEKRVISVIVSTYVDRIYYSEKVELLDNTVQLKVEKGQE